MNEEIADSSSHGKVQSEHERKQAWAPLTLEYLGDLPRQLGEIRGSLAAGDYAAIKQYAHRARGTSGTYRLDSIASAFALLEHLADEGNLDELAVTISKIQRMIELETENLRRLTSSSPESSEGNTSG